MNKLTKKDLAQIIKHDFTKELKDFEYETKFTVNNKTLSSLQVLKKVRGKFTNPDRFILCQIKAGDKLLTKVDFFIAKDTEYSTFVYRGARMIKVKRHKIINAKPFKIFKNDETLLIDKSDFKSKLHDLRHRFKRHNHTLIDIKQFLAKQSDMVPVGKMIKERVKDFVVDNHDGRIYAVAVSFCKSSGVTQKQLEIEYSGFLPSFNAKRRQSGKGSTTEKQVISGVEALSKFIYDHEPKLLTTSIERKFSFVKKLAK